MNEIESKKFAKIAIERLEDAITESGYLISGATNPHAEDSGAPAWVCRAREAISDYYNSPMLWTDDYLVSMHEHGCMGQDTDDAYTNNNYRAFASLANKEIMRRLASK
jgi:hypothetical protein